MKYIISFITALILFVSCSGDKVYVPKPRLYPKVDFPEKGYQIFDTSYCAFTFEYPKYARIEKDKYFYEDEPIDPCWFDISIPKLNGKLHCSYYPISSQERFDELVNDAFTLVGKHNIKANFRDEILVNNTNGVSGMIFDISGPVASPMQFYLTDSTRHFFRASLYFNNQVDPDSMAPVYEFVKEDVTKMIETFEWKE